VGTITEIRRWSGTGCIPTRERGNDKSAGVTLIEVLIAMVVLAIGLLGLASLQATALRTNSSALFRSQATNLAYSIVDAMRVNRAAALALPGAYNSTMPTTPPSCPTGVVALTGSIANQDLTAWTNTLACTLPQGAGEIARTGTTTFTVRVQWNDTQRWDKNGAGESETKIQVLPMTTDL